MDDSIPSIAPIAPASSVDLSTRDRAAGSFAHLRQASAAKPRQRTGTEWVAAASALAPDPVPEPVRPGDIGRDGRFEKFILALQALRFELGGVASQTDRAERMRAAAEELFSIDGSPQPVPPMTGPAAKLPFPVPNPESAALEASPVVPSDAAASEPGIASADAAPAGGGSAGPGAGPGEPAGEVPAVPAGLPPGDSGPDA
jgi:hypothetical protein